MKLDPASEVIVLSQDETWAHVDFQGAQGYVPKVNLVMDEPVNLQDLAIYIWFVGEPQQVEYGDVLTLQGKLVGFENLPYSYTLQWQRASMSKSRAVGNDWSDIPGANSLNFSFTVDKDTEWSAWRLMAWVHVDEESAGGE